MLTQGARNVGLDASVACIDENTSTTLVAASTTSANVQLAPGQWKVSLRGADATCDVYLKFGVDSTVSITEPVDVVASAQATNGGAGDPMGSFRGDEIERITVSPDATWVAYMLSASATSAQLKFVRIVAP